MSKLLLLLAGVIGLSFPAHAQIQVSREPRHHIVLENEWVRVLDVRIPPGDTTLMHKHSTPSVFVVLRQTKTGSEALIEPGRSSNSADPGIWFEGFYDKPRVHRVWNEDTAEFHVMDIELLHGSAPTLRDTIRIPYSRLLFDEKPVQGLRVDLAPGKEILLNSLSLPALIVGLSGPAANGSVNGHPFTKKGDYFFVPAGAPLNIANTSASADHHFAVFLLKGY
jgi:quercetin dioxygenase-like cupin family protein